MLISKRNLANFWIEKFLDIQIDKWAKGWSRLVLKSRPGDLCMAFKQRRPETGGVVIPTNKRQPWAYWCFCGRGNQSQPVETYVESFFLEGNRRGIWGLPRAVKVEQYTFGGARTREPMLGAAGSSRRKYRKTAFCAQHPRRAISCFRAGIE